MLSGSDDLTGRYFGSNDSARGANPRMPKPVRSTTDFGVGFGAGQFFEGDTDIHGLGGVMDDVNRSLLIDSKPKTPMDLIQADFPSTPSSVYSNRLLKSKQQETSRYVTTQDDPSPPMSPSAQGVLSQSPNHHKSASSGSESREEPPMGSPGPRRDFASNSTDGALDQATMGMSNMQVSSFPGQQQPPRGPHMNPQMQQQQMMQQMRGGQGMGGSYMGMQGAYGYGGVQNHSMQPQYNQHQQGGYMSQQEPVLGHPVGYYPQHQNLGGGGMYGNQMYYNGSNGSLNNAGSGPGQMAYQQQSRGLYGEPGEYGGMYGSPHQQAMPQQHWDGGAMGMEEAAGGRGMGGQQQLRSNGGMMYPQHQQMMGHLPAAAMYGGGAVGLPPQLPNPPQNMPNGQAQMWGGASGGSPSMSGHIQQQAPNQPMSAQGSAGSGAAGGGPMLYSQTLIQGLSANGEVINNSATGSNPQRGLPGGRGMDNPSKDRRPANSSAPNGPAGRGGNPRTGSGKAANGGPANASGGSASTTRDHLVEEFRNTFGKSKQWEIKDLVGHIVAFCQDQHGSRFIQQRLEVAPDAEKQLVFDELVPCAQSLMTDVFGNYVIQKLFEFGSPDQCEMLASMLMGQAVTLALQMYGCRVIQKALEYVNTERLVALVGEFEGQQVLRCVHDQNGNHVIQKCIEVVCRVARDSTPSAAEYMSSKIQFIITAFNGRVRELSMHPYGCRVVQRILEHCPNAQKAPVLEELRKCCNELVQDQYGNYVIQHVMQHGWDTDKAMLIREVQSHLLDYSQHKFASNVVEKCLQFANRKDRDEMIWTIIHVTFDLNNPVDVNTGQCVLESMVRDPYANYVVQKVIDVSDERQRGAIVRYVKENIVQLRRYTYGKHIIVRLEKVCNEKF